MPVPAALQTNNLDVQDECVVRNRIVTDNLAERTAGSGVTLADNLVIADATNSTSPTTGALQTAGGVGVVQDVVINGSLDIEGNLVGSAGTEMRNIEPAAVDSRTVKGVLRATYEVTVDGGTSGTTVTFGGANNTLPDNAVVTRAYYEVLEIFVSEGGDAGQISLGIATDDAVGLLAAVAISAVGAPWDPGFHECIQTGAAVNLFSEQTTAARAVQVGITVQTLTAGKLVLILEYFISN